MENEFYARTENQNPRGLLKELSTNSIYGNYQRKFRYKRGRIPIEIMKEYYLPKINPDLRGIFPPLICDYHLNVIIKGGYDVLKLDNTG